MNIRRFQEILDNFGADARRWPEAERGAALSLVARSDEARIRLLEETLSDLIGEDSGGETELEEGNENSDGDIGAERREGSP